MISNCNDENKNSINYDYINNNTNDVYSKNSTNNTNEVKRVTIL